MAKKAIMDKNRLPQINGNYFNYIKALSSTEQLILILAALCSALNILIISKNPIHAHILYGRGAVDTALSLPIFLCFITIGKVRSIQTRNETWILLCTVSFITIIYLSGLSGCTAVASTPFTRIDAALEKFDLAIHFNLPALMSWVNHGHEIILGACCLAYKSWLYQLFLLPLAMTVTDNYKRVTTFILAFTIACALGAGIYYFWPTTAPATVVHSHYFTEYQHNLVKRFVMMRQGATHLPPTIGLISFPSFHVIGAVLFILLCWKNKILRIPVLALNMLLIYSTLALGYHYMADVLAGTIIAAFSYYISSKVKT
jgi:membrane-associated phospholipid phosphatase